MDPSMSVELKQRDCQHQQEIREKLEILSCAKDESLAEKVAVENSISVFLEGLGIDLKYLSSDVREGLDKICNILKIENTNNMKCLPLRIHMQQQEVEDARKARADANFRINYDTSFRKYSRIQKKLDLIENSIRKITEKTQKTSEECENKESKRLLMLSKLNTYREKAAEMEEQLKNLKVDDLYPETIIKKSEKCVQKLEQLADLEKNLSYYRDLPPNMLQAKLVLESETQKLENIEQMIKEKLS